MMNLYEAKRIFGLSDSYTKDDVNRVYRNLMKKWHPDVNKSASAENKTKQINEAREVLLKELNHSNTKNMRSSTNNRTKVNIYVEMLKRRVESFNINDFTMNDLFDTYRKINALIAEFSKLTVADNYYFNIYSRKMDVLFAEFAKNFCTTYGLTFGIRGDKIFINSAPITFKDVSLKSFVEQVERSSYHFIYDEYLLNLFNYVRRNGQVITLGQITTLNNTYKNDATFVYLYIRVESAIKDFLAKEKLSNKKLSLLEANYSRNTKFIVNEIITFIENYCKSNKLYYSFGHGFGEIEVEGIRISIRESIFDIYNHLKMLKGSLNDNNKILIKNNKKIYNYKYDI